MGVSVSYNGSGGRRSFNLDGVPTGDAAKTLGLPQKKHYVPDTFKKMLEMPAPTDPIEEAQKGKVKLNDLDASPGTLADKMLPGGGVVASPQGVCLRGEEQSPLVNGVQLYGSVNGSKKYHTIDEIDPRGQPHHVGAKHGDDTPEPNNEPVVANQPQSYQVASRIVAERDDIAGLLKLYELDKDVSTSSFGRTVGVTAERRRMVCAIRLPRADDGDAGPLPYEVRWDAELDDGDGGWKIFLPTSHLLAYDGSYVTPTGVTAMSDGWYSLDDVQRSSTHVWLVLSVVDLTGVCTAEFSPTQGQSVTGTTVHNICVAEISYTAPAAAGDQPTVVVKQSLVGALHLESGRKLSPEPFDYHVTKDGETTSYEVDGGDFFFDGESKSVDGIKITGSGDETVYLVCTGTKVTPEDASEEESYEWEFELATEPGEAEDEDGKVINVKLYDFTDGVVTTDYRETNLPVSSGGIQYRKVHGDGVSIDWQPADEEEEPGDSALEVKGFSEAEDGSAPYKSDDEIVWGGKTIVSSDDSDGITIEYSDGSSDHIPAPADGASVTGATAGTATSSGGKTTTPITFTLSNGNTVGPVNVEAKDGAAASLNKEFQVDGTKVADIAASANIGITQKSLAAGQNITLTLSQDGKTITISAAGGSGGTSGYTGTRYTLHDTKYDLTSNCLQMRRYTETWVDGVMTNSALGSWENFSAGAQAVQETV